MICFVRHIRPVTGLLTAKWAARSVLGGVFSIVFAGSLAMAQTVDVETTDNIPDLTSEGFSLNMEASTLDLMDDVEFDFVGLSPAVKGAIIDLPDYSAGSRLFNLDFANTACLAGELSCLTPSETLDVKYNTSFAARIDKGLDIELSPRASVRFDDDSSSALVGALVRIGDDLKDASDFKNNTWYMFAGADAEAVSYSPNSTGRMTNGEFYLQDKIIVGDAQAGVGYRIGDADVSLGYFRREVTTFGNDLDSESGSYSEDAAALSFTWRR